LITGNTVIDALLQSSKKVGSIENEEIELLKSTVDFNKKIILVTGHRRENHGDGFINICAALKEIALAKGFDFVESGPLVRSSYHAEKHIAHFFGEK
jgi:UDP-N-acetylglucosamine 2-epimerase